VDKREVLTEAQLTLDEGLVGDNWRPRGSSRTPDGSASLERQITLMNMRVIALLAQSQERWALAGDQLYVDFDLSVEHLPAGAQIQIGEAVVEVSAPPHTGCNKFAKRFGPDALKFVNSPEGRDLRLRGINARIVRAGTVRVGDTIRKV
jgi:MOSC domain-containing protein YiiM